MDAYERIPSEGVQVEGIQACQVCAAFILSYEVDWDGVDDPLLCFFCHEEMCIQPSCGCQLRERWCY